MIKYIISANETVQPNSKEMAVLHENFPSCFTTEGAFDIERFKEFLSDKIAVTGEGYELKFLGKCKCQVKMSENAKLKCSFSTE